MVIFTDVTENKCIDDRHLRDNEYMQFSAQQSAVTEVAKAYISANTDAPCSTVSLR